MIENASEIQNLNSSTSRGLLAAMLVTHIHQDLMPDQTSAAAGEVSRRFLGENHPDRVKVVKAINANIRYYRKRLATLEDPNIEDPDFAPIRKAGHYGRSVWENLYGECRNLGRAGLALKAWVAMRTPKAPRGSHINQNELITALSRVMPCRLIQALNYLIEPDYQLKDSLTSFLIDNLSAAGREDLEQLAAWLGTAPAPLSCPKSRAELESWLYPEKLVTSKTAGVLDLAAQKDPEKGSRKPLIQRVALFKGLSVALLLGLMSFITAPLVMQDTRLMISSQGLPATYQYVLHLLADQQLAATDLRDCALILYHNGNRLRAVAILEEIAYNQNYSAKLRADCYLQLGRIYMDENPEASLIPLNLASQLYPTPANRNWAALETAKAYMLMQDFPQMAHWLDQATRLRLEGGYGNLVQEQQLQLRLAMYQDHLPDALEIGLEAYENWKNSDDLLVRALFARELGTLYALLGDTWQARDFTGEAMHIYGKLGDVSGMDQVLINFMLINKMEGRPPTAYQKETVQNRLKQHPNSELFRELSYLEKQETGFRLK